MAHLCYLALVSMAFIFLCIYINNWKVKSNKLSFLVLTLAFQQLKGTDNRMSFVTFLQRNTTFGLAGAYTMSGRWPLIGVAF